MQKYEEFIEAYPKVKDWLQNRSKETQRSFATRLQRFCEAMGVTPEDWRMMDKFQARDLVWIYIKPKINDHPSVAQADLVALKSWFRNHNGEQLPFDSGKGGKHYFHISHPKRAIEHIPSKREFYQILDMTSSLRDKAILIFLFQSGVRVNVLEHITFGDVKHQLGNNIIVLKITGKLDHKLRSRDIPFYYTFLNGEGAETLRRYCEVQHNESREGTPLFVTVKGNPINQRWVWKITKMVVERAGFNPKTITTHTFRKAFRRQVAQAEGVDQEFKEMVMGHVITGSRENYFDRNNLEWFVEQYQKVNFGRDAVGSETTKLKVELDEERKERDLKELRMRREIDELTKRIESRDRKIKKMETKLNGLTLNNSQVKELLRRIEKLEQQARPEQ